MRLLILLLTLSLISCSNVEIHQRSDFHYRAGNIVCRNNDCCWVKDDYLFCTRASSKEVFIYIKIFEQ